MQPNYLKHKTIQSEYYIKFLLKIAISEEKPILGLICNNNEENQRFERE